MTRPTSHPTDQVHHPLPEVDPRDEAAMALLGHDLRAALADVIGGLQLIDPEALDLATRAQFDRARVSGEVLARLLDQGLAVMLGEAENLPAQSVALESLLSDIRLRWTGRAAAKGLSFQLTAAPELPRELSFDQLSVERVLSNLLGNAIKYTDAGIVRCDIGRMRDGRLAFTVADQGPGFPASVLTGPHVFHRRPTGMTKLGSGMGLHIAEILTAGMGGQLRLRNLAGGGAEVVLLLPAPVAPPKAPPLSLDLSAHRVLVADDNPTSRLVLTRLLAGLGATDVVVVADGLEAVAQLTSEPFDLLIVDIEMPHFSGVEVIRSLRTRSGPTAKLPILAVTAYTRRTDFAMITAAGANAILTKTNLTNAAFRAALTQILQAQAAQSLVQARTAPATRDPALMDDTRFIKLLQMAGPDTARELIVRLLDDLQTVRTGLSRAASSPDWAAIRAQSHVLISLAGAVGALRLQERAEALNRRAQGEPSEAPTLEIAEVVSLLDALVDHVTWVRDDQRETI